MSYAFCQISLNSKIVGVVSLDVMRHHPVEEIRNFSTLIKLGNTRCGVLDVVRHHPDDAISILLLGVVSPSSSLRSRGLTCRHWVLDSAGRSKDA